MANTFTRNIAMPMGGHVGKSQLQVSGTLVIDTPGGAVAGDLPASLFGLNKITFVGAIVENDDSAIYSGAPAFNGESLLIQGGTDDDGTTVFGVQDLTAGTYAITLTGY